MVWHQHLKDSIMCSKYSRFVPIIIFLHTRVTIKFYILKITIRRIMSISQVMRTLITRHLIFANTIILAHTPLLFMLFSAVLIEP